MKPTRNDRRSLRTRRLIENALVELMLEQQFDAITVQNVLDRANVGRSTFYSHYLDKQDVLSRSLEQMLHGLESHRQDSSEGAQPDQEFLPSLELLLHVKKHERLYKALLWGPGIDFVSRTLQAQLAHFVEQNLLTIAEPHGLTSVPTSVTANFVAGAFLTLLHWWLNSNTVYSPEQVDLMFRQLVRPGVQNALGIESGIGKSETHHE